jgi:hypothetical protein
MVCPQNRRKKFDFYIAIEFRIVGFVDDPHASFAEFFQDFVMGDGLADHTLSLPSGDIRETTRFVDLIVKVKIGKAVWII